MLDFVETQVFILTVALIVVIGAIASIIALVRRNKSQSIDIGGKAEGSIEQLAGSDEIGSQKISIKGDVDAEVQQKRT